MVTGDGDGDGHGHEHEHEHGHGHEQGHGHGHGHGHGRHAHDHGHMETLTQRVGMLTAVVPGPKIRATRRAAEVNSGALPPKRTREGVLPDRRVPQHMKQRSRG